MSANKPSGMFPDIPELKNVDANIFCVAFPLIFPKKSLLILLVMFLQYANVPSYIRCAGAPSMPANNKSEYWPVKPVSLANVQPNIYGAGAPFNPLNNSGGISPVNFGQL